MGCGNFGGKDDSALEANTLTSQRENFFAIYDVPASTWNDRNAVTVLSSVEIMGEESAIRACHYF